MKTIYATLLATFLCLLPTLRADVTIVQKVTGAQAEMETTTEIKGGKVRVNASPATSIIIDQKSGGMLNLMHAQKKYMRISSQMIQAMASAKKAAGDQTPPTLTPTGKKDTISGFPCEEYNCTVMGSTLTLWLTKALPDYESVLKQMGVAFNEGPMSAMMKSLGVDFSTLPGFPVRTLSEVQPGVNMTSTVVSVSTKPIPDADFDLPADYQEMKLPSLTPPAAEQAPAVSK